MSTSSVICAGTVAICARAGHRLTRMEIHKPAATRARSRTRCRRYFAVFRELVFIESLSEVRSPRSYPQGCKNTTRQIQGLERSVRRSIFNSDAQPGATVALASNFSTPATFRPRKGGRIDFEGALSENKAPLPYQGKGKAPACRKKSLSVSCAKNPKIIAHA